ncbi:ATP-binding protein [Alkalihalobacillus hwajinpoensis]|uniref:ATP-binding protein n=1 Tax=Guptibacillus hwajinpoensis TaxID=208199 RepID=UPI0018846B2F|nr:ATP-binding protein [Pseudalkalibacillus hwajinpoensis]MBF0709383.1 ATP-binding protein [Pseudalkalibacillus hwajinpoensis]
MSVEISGVQGYEYQYLATVYIALSNLEKDNIELIVEKKGGEDAELIIVEDGQKNTVEIQVKSTQADLTLKELTSWLNHFPDRLSENNLIDRLKTDVSRSVLFITRARGTDIVRPFLTDNIYLNRGSINNGLLNSIPDYLEENNDKSTPLREKRAMYSSIQANYFRNHSGVLRSICKRILVWEMLSEETLTNKCIELMNKKYFVPLNKAKSVLIELIDLVKVARDLREDVIPSILQLLDRYKGNQIYLNPVNVDREGIEEAIKLLEERNVLLLTGISFCGKTHLARRIAKELQYSGYNCLIESDIKEARRFLMQNSLEERLCVIEDPFGQVELEDNFYEVWSTLSQLIENLGPNRKIIVTSKKELLRRLKNTDNPHEWMLEGNEWTDLTVQDHQFIQNVWNAYCLEKNISTEVAELVKKNLNELHSNNLLQPGQLRHLAFRDKSELIQKDFEDLVQLATVDAHTLGMYFNTKSNEFNKVLMALGLGSDTTQAIKFKELTHVLSNSEDQPSLVILKEDYQMMDFPGKKSSPSFPEYTSDAKLPDWILEHLEDMEINGYVTVVDDNILFTHPTYYEASKYVIKHQRRSQLGQIVHILSKGIGCLEPKTAFMYTKQIEKLFSNYSSNQVFKDELISLAIKSLNSIFPSIRDSGLIFLLSIIDNQSNDLQKVVYDFIKHNDIKNSRVFWQEGEPWLEVSNSTSFVDYLDDLLRNHDNNDVENIANKLIQPHESKNVSSEEAWKIASNEFLFEEEDKNLRLIAQLLSYKESFIRSKIAFTVARYFSDSKQHIDIVFSDEHPNVVYQAIRGAMRGWNSFNCEHKAYLMNYMTQAMSNKIVAANTSRFLIDFGDDFGRDYIDRSSLNEDQTKELWSVWSELFPIFLQTVPNNFVSLNESDLFNTVIKSVEYIDSSAVVKIAESWLYWIEKNLPNRLLHESGYAVSDFLLKKTEPSERQRISERILSQEDTNFITVALSEFVDKWTTLSDGEKQKIISLLQSNREDVRWLKAVCLTRTKVPEIISSIVLGKEKIFEEEIIKVIDYFPVELLTDCLRVFIGNPQPLWWLGYHHPRGTRWPEMLLRLLEIPEHPSFKVALSNFVDRFINGAFRDEQRIQVLEVWENIISYKDNCLSDYLFSELKVQCISNNGPDIKDLWSVFFNNINNEKKSYYINDVVKEVEAFTYFNEIYEIFHMEFFEKEILPQLTADNILINMVMSSDSILNNIEEDVNSYIKDMYTVIEKVYSIESPRLNLTNTLVENFFSRKYEVIPLSDLIESINQASKKITEEGRKKKKDIVEFYDLQHADVINDWVSLYQKD